jgi:D-alanyl-D-alanine dipeptidase
MRKRKIRLVKLIVAMLLAPFSVVSATAEDDTPMPKGFVYLREIAPDILQDIRYAGAKNFTGRPLPGYRSAECILVMPAAIALSRVQVELKLVGLGLKVFDCYRPVRAVRAFLEWASAPEDAALKTAYYPRIKKSALIPRYIAKRSGHSRGAAVDLTLVALNGARSEKPAASPVCDVEKPAGEANLALDMGTAFDCFDPLSETRANGISQTQRANRERLLAVMTRHGFRNYSGEWWHFSFSPEPYPKRYFDFTILPYRK